VGTVLIGKLIDIARKEGLALLTAWFLAGNGPMQKIFTKLGFSFRDTEDPEVREAELRV
jgi:GNAT superfamily N-acetyltransferase